MKKAKFYSQLKEDKVVCNLCPNHCHLHPNQEGICRIRINKNGNLYTTNYGKACSISVDPIEKKPLYHYYPSDEILSLGTKSCNLRCNFCQNYTISQGDVALKEISPENLLKMVLENKYKMVAFTYNEPIIWYEFLYDCAKLLDLNNIKVVLVTNGYIQKEPLDELLPYIHALNVDIKSMSDEFYHMMCFGRLGPVLETVKRSVNAGKHVEVTNLVIPGKNDNEDDLNALINFIYELNPEMPLHFSRYFPRYKSDIPSTPIDTLTDFHEKAKKRLKNVYIGNVKLDEENNTYCSECNSLLIHRNYYKTKIVNMKGNTCNNCGKKIYGSFDKISI